ncbi:PREDICTED: neuromedin-U [Charadrius vociferus]|uniref:neuromedin-U n=1 Tax=Charadrius vociferus TaxID=50402 RepID=UPI0005215A9C|nr:PREDICTED: neuromedin-U [Charadrius vociferus]
METHNVHMNADDSADYGATPPNTMGKLWMADLQTSEPTYSGAPVPSQALEVDEDLQLWKEIDDACSVYLSRDSQPQASSALEELCFLVVAFLQKPQGLDEKDNTKRFLFHYSKTHDSGNSDITSSVLHPLLQLVPQLNERRLKRYKVDEELQRPGGIQSRGYFFYRPRNGRRSVDFR